MSKRNNDGDVIANRLSLVEAKGQRLLASLFGSPSEPNATNNGVKSIDEDEDLKQDFLHDRLGVGAVLPKDVEDGSFTRRIPTSNDKLLEQLVGKKKAKAHMAAQKEATRPNAKAQKFGRVKPREKEESDDEEGRGAVFKSKRRKASNSELKDLENGGDHEDEESRTKRSESDQSQPDANGPSSEVLKAKDEMFEADAAPEATGAPRNESRRAKTKPKSFLDEILAERSKKKNKKKKG